jgi:hypothetical protein
VVVVQLVQHQKLIEKDQIQFFQQLHPLVVALVVLLIKTVRQFQLT